MTDVKARTAKGKEKPYKLSDSDGLYLFVTPAGGKCWRFKYRFGGKEKLLAFGTYPEVSLADAREKRDAARKWVAAEIDPGEVRKAKKEAQKAVSENSFEVVAREWHGKYSKTWSAVHADTLIDRLEKEVFPWLGARPIEEIKAPELLKVLRRVESRGALDSAHRIRTLCSQVFRYAVATGRAERDPGADLRGALPPVKNNHFAAPTDPKDVAPLLRAIDDYQGSFIGAPGRAHPLGGVSPLQTRQGELLAERTGLFREGKSEGNRRQNAGLTNRNRIRGCHAG